jgi:peptidyl-prolyl cis-trans isomerase C
MTSNLLSRPFFKNVRVAAMCAALAAGCVCSPAFAQNIAVVNGTPIPTSRANALVQELISQGQQDSPQLQGMVREELVNREVMYQEALKEGIANRPDVKAQLALTQQSVILRALLQDYMAKHPITDAEVKARYDELAKQMGGEEYHLHHILVDNEQLAKDIIAKLKAGGDFEALAKPYSKDPGSAEHGGDLSWSDPKAYVPEFAAAAMKLKKGEITDTPVQTKFGWHIIRLDDTRPVQPPAFDDVKDQLRKQMEQDQLQQWEKSLVAQAKIQ